MCRYINNKINTDHNKFKNTIPILGLYRQFEEGICRINLCFITFRMNYPVK